MSTGGPPVGGLVLVTVLLAGLFACGPGRDGSGDRFLRRSWDRYLELYLRDSAYVVDPRRDGGAVTSEGQGYLLLRAAWLRDEEVFRRAFRWTEAHLRRPDGLYSWVWSPESREVLDPNTAADADQEIALALVLAAEAFEEPGYRERARGLVRAIRTREALDVPGGWLPAAGDWAVEERIYNPSYFLPYAYPYFQAVDPAGEWDAVTRAGYRFLERLERDPAFRLPPDFLRVTPEGAPEPLPEDHVLSRDFSFDAVRVYWRLAADCRLRPEGRCRPGPGLSYLAREIRTDGRVVTRYDTSGRALSEEESPSFYGALLPTLARHHPEQARRIRMRKLGRDALERLARAEARYYDRNWVWFGLALEGGLIPRRTPLPAEVAGD